MSREFGYSIHHEEALWHTLETIGDYIEKSYGIFSNPLPHLRRILPAFDWNFNRPATRAVAATRVKWNDYSWLVCPELDWSMGLVTATRIRLDSENYRRIAYFPSNDRIEVDTAWPIEELRGNNCLIFMGNQFL